MRPALLFLGTPEFASVSLKTLLMDGRFEVRAVITQPDRPAQRKLRLQSSAVAQCTPKSIPLWKPENIKDIPLEQVTAMECMCAVVVAYGQIFAKELDVAISKRHCQSACELVAILAGGFSYSTCLDGRRQSNWYHFAKAGVAVG